MLILCDTIHAMHTAAECCWCLSKVSSDTEVVLILLKEEE